MKEAIWLKELTDELSENDECVVVHCDSQSAVFLSKNQTYHDRTKHINVRCHFLPDILREGQYISWRKPALMIMLLMLLQICCHWVSLIDVWKLSKFVLTDWKLNKCHFCSSMVYLLGLKLSKWWLIYFDSLINVHTSNEADVAKLTVY